MNGEYLPRTEFDLFCRQQNGSLRRIEASLETINCKLDALGEAINQRVTWEAHDRRKQECREEIARFRNRPSWAVAVVVAFFSSATVSLLVLVLSRVI